jgi:hypothetical protein
MDLLFWIYLINAVVLINHEIDSAYWQEWKLINPNDQLGIRGFLILHFPMLFAILLGLVLVHEGKLAGMIISLALSAGGLFAFFFHSYHLKKGKGEFDTTLSKGIIVSTFVISLFQMFLTVRRLAG